jgi:hypothetical protein
MTERTPEEPRIGRNPDGTDGSTERIVNNGAQTLHGGVIMDVITPEQARIAEEAGVCAIMAIERVPADIRAQGGVARMSDPGFIHDIKCAVTIPVMAKAHNGHFVETQILEAIGVDYVDDCEVLTLADDAHHINKHFFHCPGKDHGGHPCAKHLLGDDISGNKKGVCNMLATANAITKLLMGLEIKVLAVPAAPPWRPPDARRNVNNLLMQQSKNLHEARFTRHTRHLSDIDQRSSFAQLHLLKGRNNCDTSTMESGSDVDDLGSPMMRNTLERSSVGCSRLAPVREEMQTRARDSTAYYGCDDHFAVVDKTVDYGQGGSMSDRSSASEIRPEARPLHTSRAPHMPTEDINLFHDPISCNSSELFQSHGNNAIYFLEGQLIIKIDALSSKEQSTPTISLATTTWLTDIEASYCTDSHHTNLIHQLLINEQAAPHFSVNSGILGYKKIYIGPTTKLRSEILSFLHSSAQQRSKRGFLTGAMVNFKLQSHSQIKEHTGHQAISEPNLPLAA